MGKIYACSDIHGQYEKYMKLWDIVTDDDELYIIGDEGRVMDAGDRFVFPLMDLQHVPAYLKPPIECWDENVTYIVGHVIVQRLSSPKMIRVPFYDNVAGDKKVVEFLDIDGGLAAYKHYGQGGLLDSLGLILYSLSDDKAIYL